jgi:hypothetical protein
MKDALASAGEDWEKITGLLYLSAETILVNITVLVVPVRRGRETALEVLLDDEIDLIPKQIESAVGMEILSEAAHLGQDHDLVPW